MKTIPTYYFLCSADKAAFDSLWTGLQKKLLSHPLLFILRFLCWILDCDVLWWVLKITVSHLSFDIWWLCLSSHYMWACCGQTLVISAQDKRKWLVCSKVSEDDDLRSVETCAFRWNARRAQYRERTEVKPEQLRGEESTPTRSVVVMSLFGSLARMKLINCCRHRMWTGGGHRNHGTVEIDSKHLSLCKRAQNDKYVGRCGIDEMCKIISISMHHMMQYSVEMNLSSLKQKETVRDNKTWLHFTNIGRTLHFNSWSRSCFCFASAATCTSLASVCSTASFVWWRST